MSNMKRLNDIQLDFYDNYYSKLAAGGAGGWYHNFTHKYLEKMVSPTKSFDLTLEVGAGAGEHLKFVKHKFQTYYHTDVRDVSIITKDPRVIKLICDASEIPLADDSCDRVIVTCLLHHVENPLLILHEVRRILKVDGVGSFLLPSDPGLMYRILRKISSERKLKKLGFQHGKFLHAIEHRNHIQSLNEQIKFVFTHDFIKVRCWPFGISSMWNLNSIYAFMVVKK